MKTAADLLSEPGNLIQSKGRAGPSEVVEKPSEFDSEGSNSTDGHSEGSAPEPQLPVELAEAIRALGKRAPEEAVRSVVRKLGSWNDLALPVLASLLGRSEVCLRQKIVSPMVRAEKLEFTIPDEPNHPRQRDRAAHH